MTSQELATVVEYELPIKFAIINNGYLGMVRQWQELFYKNNLSAVRMYQPDFVKLAEAYGMRGLRVTDKAQVAVGASTWRWTTPARCSSTSRSRSTRTRSRWCRRAPRCRRRSIRRTAKTPVDRASASRPGVR